MWLMLQDLALDLVRRILSASVWPYSLDQAYIWVWKQYMHVWFRVVRMSRHNTLSHGHCHTLKINTHKKNRALPWWLVPVQKVPGSLVIIQKLPCITMVAGYRGKQSNSKNYTEVSIAKYKKIRRICGFWVGDYLFCFRKFAETVWSPPYDVRNWKLRRKLKFAMRPEGLTVPQ